MQNIYGITFEELEDYFIKNNDKKFKATQVYNWVYKKRISSFEEMRNVSKDTINTMKSNFYFSKLEIIDKRSDKDTAKYFNLSFASISELRINNFISFFLPKKLINFII